MKKVGFIGLGVMGQGMAARLITKGFAVTVWNRDPQKADALVGQGAQKADSSAALVDGSEVIVSMIRDDAAVRAMFLGDTGAFAHAHAGQTFIDMSTVTPGMVRDLAAAAEAAQLHFLEAPVLGSKGAAASGELTILVGGDATVLEAQRDVLDAMGSRIMHIGAHGTAATLKLANNQLAGVMLAALGESLALVEAAGIDHAFAADMLTGTAARIAGAKKERIVNHKWDDAEFALELSHKDLTQALVAAGDYDLPMPILAAARETFQRAKHAGKGGLDFSAIADTAE